MSTPYSDLSATTIQSGTAQPSYPLQPNGDFYHLSRRREMVALQSNYAPIVGNRTSYTNTLTYSDDFSNAAWTKTRSSATAASTDPEGGATASKLVEDSSNNTHYAEQAATIASGAMTFGVLAKAAERSWIFTTISNATDGTLTSAYFDLSTGVTGTVGGGTATIRNAGNGWYWCYITATATVANSKGTVIIASANNSISYSGTSGYGVYLWHATAVTGAQSTTTPWPAIGTTSTTRTVSSPPVDPDDPLCFLCVETEPDLGELARGTARWARIYSRVSAGTTTYSTISVNKPTVGSVAGTASINMRSIGGTNYGAQYNYNGYWWNTVTNKVYGAQVVTTSADNGANTDVTWTAHGLAGTEEIGVYGLSGSTQSFWIFASGTYTIVNANTVKLTAINLGTSGVIAAKYLRAYTSGLDRLPTKQTQSFYLPGITTGITTGADITIPSPLLNGTQFLAAVVANTSGYVFYDSKELALWSGQIYVLEKTYVNFAYIS